MFVGLVEMIFVLCGVGVIISNMINNLDSHLSLVDKKRDLLRTLRQNFRKNSSYGKKACYLKGTKNSDQSHC